MDDYVKVDVNKYVKLGLESGMFLPRQAEKFARIVARRGSVDETIVSWSTDKDGNPIEERVGVIKLDDVTQQPGWVVTKVNENGEIIIDQNGHSNEWIIEDSTFIKKYEIDPQNPTLYRPKGGLQTFVQIPDNIILEQWGSEMKIASGGYINITNPDDMYGISKRDFIDTYKFSDSSKIK